MDIRAISLDLDDTLWPIEPAILRAEERLHRWLSEHCPPVAEAYPMPAMRALRERVSAEHPHLAHDFTAQRKISLRTALVPHGYDEDKVEAAFEVFFCARNDVEVYADTLPALRRLASRYPLVSLTNGNADLQRIGLHSLFMHTISARELGIAKPDPKIFLHACERLRVAPAQVLHVGDDPDLDVRGAREAGMATVWLNRRGETWSHSLQPDLTFTDLSALADWLQVPALASA